MSDRNYYHFRAKNRFTRKKLSTNSNWISIRPCLPSKTTYGMPAVLPGA